MRVDGEPATRREPDEFPIAVVATEHTVPNLEPVGLRSRVQFVVLIRDLVSPFRPHGLEDLRPHPRMRRLAHFPIGGGSSPSRTSCGPARIRRGLGCADRSWSGNHPRLSSCRRTERLRLLRSLVPRWLPHPSSSLWHMEPMWPKISTCAESTIGRNRSRVRRITTHIVDASGP